MITFYWQKWTSSFCWFDTSFNIHFFFIYDKKSYLIYLFIFFIYFFVLWPCSLKWLHLVFHIILLMVDKIQVWFLLTHLVSIHSQCLYHLNDFKLSSIGISFIFHLLSNQYSSQTIKHQNNGPWLEYNEKNIGRATRKTDHYAQVLRVPFQSMGTNSRKLKKVNNR